MAVKRAVKKGTKKLALSVEMPPEIGHVAEILIDFFEKNPKMKSVKFTRKQGGRLGVLLEQGAKIESLELDL